MKESPVSKDFIYGAAKNLRAAFPPPAKLFIKIRRVFYAFIKSLNEADSPLTGSVTVTSCSTPTLL